MIYLFFYQPNISHIYVRMRNLNTSVSFDKKKKKVVEK